MGHPESEAAKSDREFDIIIFGATGFVGKLTAQYLAAAGGGARIALAGRAADRLLAVRDSLGETAQSWPLIAADASQPSTLNAMAASTRVVITTVGPYLKYGLPLVAACAAAGTDYADLTGEPLFIRKCIDLHHKQAVDTGARIVHSCGFDSIPSDLTVFALYRQAERDGAGQLGDTNFVVRRFAGGMSGGTVASMAELAREASADPEARRLLNDPYTLTPDRSAEPELGGQPDARWRRGRDIAPELDGYWVGAFAMAVPNTRIVRRSNALLGYAYGRRFEYAEQMSMGRSFAAPVAAAMATGGNAATMALGSRYFNRLPGKLVERIAPKPGTGPSERAREQGHYTVETYTTTSTGARYKATMSQKGDPGYKATSV
ncbi:MAG TPA: saccharopine dehydrogenase NADP-binding domain-containing protein, partial [Mycobacterium sp.]|nr:saccharopine dehydrogenase NADP-binding domain-containing protein [Mycobacterium sp.]